MAEVSNPSRTEVRARVFRALGDASRCQIVDLLRESGELRVGDIASAFEMSLNGVSKHIKVLEQAGIVARRHEGVSHYLSIQADAFAPLTEWLQGAQPWEARLDAFSHLVTAETETPEPELGPTKPAVKRSRNKK